MRCIKRIRLLLFGICLQFTLAAQNNSKLISQKLIDIGFENVRVSSMNDKILIAFENNVYRWDIEALSIALDTISAYTNNHKQISLFLLHKNIPQVQIHVPAERWAHYRAGIISKSVFAEAFVTDYRIDNDWKNLQDENIQNSNINKVDLVIYPQLALQNIMFKPIYEVQFNIAPALEVDVWKGMKITGQMIFPVVNQINQHDDNIRLGFVTLNQSFRIGKAYFARAVAGNFNAGRYGFDATLFRPMLNNHLELEGNIGYTGTSRFANGKWLYGTINKLSWFIRTRYFDSLFNLQMSLSVGRYLYGDHGIRADLTRHFGAVAIGFYAFYTQHDPNGGFHLTIPLSPRKNNRNHALRAKLANYFDWQYNAGTEFIKGRYYETHANDNKTENIYNSSYIKTQILKL